MKPLSGGFSQGTKLQKQQGSDPFLSKACEANNKYRLFASVAEFEGEKSIVAPAMFGRSCEYDIVGTSFHICNNFEKLDSGKLVDNSPLKRYAQVGRILFEARCASEIENVKRTAAAEAEKLGEEVDVVSLNKAIEEIEIRYHGGTVAGQNILPTESVPIQSPRVHIATTFVLVKLDANGKPEADSIKRVVFAITGAKRTSQLEECLRNADQEQLDAGFIEIKWDYTGSTDKKVCGQNAKFEAVPRDQQLATTQADWWRENAKKITDLLIFDPEIMAGRNRNFAYQITTDELIKRFKKYCSEKRALISFINMGAEETQRSAEDLASIDVFMNNSKFNKAITDILEAKKAASAEEKEDEEAIDGLAGDIAGSSTLSEAVNKAGGVETLAGVLDKTDEEPGALE